MDTRKLRTVCPELFYVRFPFRALDALFLFG